MHSGEIENEAEAPAFEQLFINILFFCNILYDLLGTHELLRFGVWDLEACSRKERNKRVQSKMSWNEFKSNS